MNIQEKILIGQRRILEKKLFPRKKPDIDLLSLSKIITFLGGRRTGKTSLMIEIVQGYIQTGIKNIDDIVFLDFSERDNHTMSLTEIYRSFGSRKPFFILDEIQELENFESELIFLYNEWCDIFVSGSNSHLLSSDIATKLRGRSYEVYNDILDFDEFLIFRQSTLRSQAERDILYDEYLLWWGYPEVVLQSSPEAKRSLLQSYLDVIIYRDLIDRYSIRNPDILSSLIRTLILSHTKPCNISKIYHTYKSLGYSVSKNTLYEYIGYLENNFFISRVRNFYRKSYFDKIYILDNGYMNLYSNEENLGQKFENTIYKILRKKWNQLGYIDTPQDVDFTDGESNIQVTYQITEENLSRETVFARSAGKNILVVRSYSQFETIENVKIIRYDQVSSSLSHV